MNKFSVSRGTSVASVLVASMLAASAVVAAPMGSLGSTAPAGVQGQAVPVHARGPHMGPARGFGMNDHIDGRIAFLKAELKITSAQTTAWNGVEKAMRDQSAATKALRDQFRAEREKVRAEREKTGATEKTEKGERRQALTAPEMLALRGKMTDGQIKAITVRAEGQKQFASAFTTLYGQLSDDQKKTADSLLARGHHGPRGHR